MVSRKCRQCGNIYETRRKSSRFCSRECYGNSGRRSIERVFALISIDPLTGCHEWKGFRDTRGYGRTRLMGERQLVHRIVWENRYGPVPENLELDHMCRNTSCCNPEHLRAVTSKVNVLASENPCAENARKTHCPKCGSEFSPRKNGGRYCRPCHIKKNTEYVKNRAAEDPAFRERLLEATRRYEDKRRTNPEAIQRGSTRPLNENCPKCGGPYGTFPSGARYCMPCRKAQQAEYQQRYRAQQQAKLKQEKD